MLKSELRKIYRAKRDLLSDSDKHEMSIKIVQNLINNFEFNGKVVNVFLPIEHLNEIDTFLIIDELQKYNATICTPVSDFCNHTLKQMIYDENSVLEKNEWGIPEPVNGIEISPKAIDVVLVPLLVTDKSGFRVGYGKGFYDRFLAECSNNTVFIGLNYFGPVSLISDLNATDISLNYLATPNQIFNF